MSRLFTRNEATAAVRRFPVYLVDATDGITPETGEVGGQPQISKAGGPWVNTSNLLVALGNGAYYVELTAAELDTLGIIQVRYSSAETAEFNMDGEVLANAVLSNPAAPITVTDAASGLETIKLQILQRITDITAAPKPNYTIRNQTVAWADYLDSLWAKLKDIDKMIQQNSATFEVESFGW